MNVSGKFLPCSIGKLSASLLIVLLLSRPSMFAQDETKLQRDKTLMEERPKASRHQDNIDVAWSARHGLNNAIVQNLMERVEQLEEKCQLRQRRDDKARIDKRDSNDELFSTDGFVSDSQLKDSKKKAKDDIKFIQPEGDRNKYIFHKEARVVPNNHKTRGKGERGHNKNQLEHIYTMLHQQQAMVTDDHSRLQRVSDLMYRHVETLEGVSAETVILQQENKRLSAKVDRLQASLDLYQLANDNFVNYTNGVVKRLKRVENNLEGLYKDQGEILQSIDDLEHADKKLTKGYKKLSQRMQHIENVTGLQTYRAYTLPKVDSAARKIDVNDGTNDNEDDVSNNEISEIDPEDSGDMSRLSKKYKKLSKQLEDTTQKLYRLSNYVSEYSTALQIIESGQDVGMRNDEYLADNQRALRKEVKDMGVKVQTMYLHYREDLRRHGSLLPEEVAPTYGYGKIYHTSTHIPADQSTHQKADSAHANNNNSNQHENNPSPEQSESAQNEQVSHNEPSESLFPDDNSDNRNPESSSKVTQVFVTPPPSSHWSASAAHYKSSREWKSHTASRISTPDPRISKRTTQHENYDYQPGETEIVIDSGGQIMDGSEAEDGRDLTGNTEHNNETSQQQKTTSKMGENQMRENEHKTAIDKIHTPTIPMPNCHVKSIGKAKPVAFREDFISGTWMKDGGVPHSPIYVTTGSDEFRQVLIYNDLWHLLNNNYSGAVHLSFHCAGSGHVFYMGSLYCNKKNSNRLMRYDLQYGVVTSQKLFKAGYNNTYPYTTGLATDLDFAVDESGLWVIYGSLKHDGRLTVAKLDPHTLDVRSEWVTKYYKKDAVNAFIVCGKVYIVTQNKNESGAEIPVVFDTQTASLMKLQNPLKLGGESVYLTMLDYNPMESRLFGWGLTRSWLGELLIFDLVVERD